jgi:hypothetical protein
MKRKAFALTFVLALLFSAVTGSQLSLLVKANFVFSPAHPVITVESPTNRTYNTNSLSLEITVRTIKTGYILSGRIYNYTLDEKEPERILITNSSVATNPGGDVFYEGAANLSNLTEGLHSLKVHVLFVYSDANDPNTITGGEHYRINTESVSTVNFRVDTVPQNISILMPKNTIYTPTGVPLRLLIDEPASWTGYSLDGQENVTVKGNVMLPELSVGQHTLALYANDTSGNPATSKTIAFTVAEEPFPVVPVAAASVASAGVIAVGLLFYFKKRKR